MEISVHTHIITPSIYPQIGLCKVSDFVDLRKMDSLLNATVVHNMDTMSYNINIVYPFIDLSLQAALCLGGDERSELLCVRSPFCRGNRHSIYIYIFFFAGLFIFQSKR